MDKKIKQIETLYGEFLDEYEDQVPDCEDGFYAGYKRGVEKEREKNKGECNHVLCPECMEKIHKAQKEDYW